MDPTRILWTRNSDLDQELELTNDFANNLNNMRAAGAIIDDDNIPVEENIPDPMVTIHNNDNVFEAEWGFKGICYRKRDGNIDCGASIPVQNAMWEQYDCVDWFLLFFPIDYVKEQMLLGMNERLDKGRPKIKWWEYLRWIGIWFLLSTTDGHYRASFWQTDNNTDARFEGAPF